MRRLAFSTPPVQTCARCLHRFAATARIPVVALPTGYPLVRALYPAPPRLSSLSGKKFFPLSAGRRMPSLCPRSASCFPFVRGAPSAFPLSAERQAPLLRPRNPRACTKKRVLRYLAGRVPIGNTAPRRGRLSEILSVPNGFFRRFFRAAQAVPSSPLREARFNRRAIGRAGQSSMCSMSLRCERR